MIGLIVVSKSVRGEYEGNTMINVRSVGRLVWQGYSRILLEALSTRPVFSCRIDKTCNVVVCTTEGRRVLSVELGDFEMSVLGFSL